MPVDKTPLIETYRTRIVVSAVLIVAVSILYLYFKLDTARDAGGQRASAGDSYQKVIQQLARVEQVPAYFPSTVRGGQKDQALERFHQGMGKYRHAKYEEAVGLLEEATRLDPNHHPTIFYLGICYLIIGRTDDCIQELAKLSGSVANPYSEESHWFLAKAYLKMKDLVSSRRELESVVSLNGVYVNDARKSLQIMEGLVNSPR